MRWTRTLAWLALAGTGAIAGNAAYAATPSAPGTIYFQDLSTLDASDNTVMLYSMDGDGGSRTAVLRTDRYVKPSRNLHGSSSARWFLTMKTTEDEEIGGNPRRDVYAVRADGTEMRLTADPTIEFWMPDWVLEAGQGDPNEGWSDYAVVSVLGRRWTSDASDATVVPGTAGMYLAILTFDGTPTLRGWANPRRHLFDDVGASGFNVYSAEPLLFGRVFDASDGDRTPSTYFESCGGPHPDVATYVWGWTYYGFGVLIQDQSSERPRIRLGLIDNDFSEIEGVFAEYLELRPRDFPDQFFVDGQDPQITGNGFYVHLARLVHADDQGPDRWKILSVEIGAWLSGDDSGAVVKASVPAPATAAASRSLTTPVVAPDESYFAYQLRWNGKGTTYYVARGSGGNGSTDLTPNVRRAAAGEAGMVLVAWR